MDELVLDLRYNGGGRVSTAQILASYIAGINGVGSDVTRLEWNDLQNQRNERVPFLSLENQLDLNRLYVLTLSGTCSASELVMNALTGIAGIELVTIGQATCGKPVGSVSFNFDDKVLQPITFSVVNDIGNGDYFDGIDATCFVEDDTARKVTEQVIHNNFLPEPLNRDNYIDQLEACMTYDDITESVTLSRSRLVLASEVRKFALTASRITELLITLTIK